MRSRSNYFKIGIALFAFAIFLLALLTPSSQDRALASSPSELMAQFASYQQADTEEEPSDVPDHSLFPILQGPFESGPEVTAACITCHSKAAEEIMQTSHWTWQSEDPVTGEEIGKATIVNNFCIGVASNEARCTSCHVGYGWTDIREPLEEQTAVDCLVCHDTTGQYKKYPTDAGHPAYVDKVFSGKEFPAVDLAFIAQNIGPTSNETCGTCHFYGGGGEGVKHGSLDSSLLDASFDLDVHMSADGANFQCTDCHQTSGHQIPGSLIDMGQSDNLTCENCHTTEPHDYTLLNNHNEKVACQTCHIPEYARGGNPTKAYWDWSTAGQLNEDGAPFQIKDENGDIIYDSKKGDFVWEYNAVPEYIWFNGTFDYVSITDTIDPSQSVVINVPIGELNDGESRIFPMKEFIAISPYDSGYNTLVIPNLFPKPGDDSAYAFWKSWDMSAAIQYGMSYLGLPFSGSYDYVETIMYWPQTHMVAPKEYALDCQECHTPADGRLDFEALGYTAEVAERLENFPPNLEFTETGAEANTPESCAECHIHEGQYELWLESSHSDKGVGCVACHTLQGEGDHPAVAYSREKSADVCGACHLDHHSDWELSIHAEANIVCSDCHEPHRQGQRLLEGNETTCETCHIDVAGDVTHSTHWAEGFTCLECHKNTDAHGTYSNTGHSFQVYVGTCLSCHADTIHTADTILQYELTIVENEEPAEEPTEEQMEESTVEEEEEEYTGAILEFPAWAGILFGVLLGFGGFWVVFGKEPGSEK